ncbi:MAG TPA: nicotinate phosphoribosyltransferase [Terriglobales bacterium]|nr:nicotinate phosphoribosyltransferase [Terriglobales bacterium]
MSEERQSAALLTDLYELTMAAAYFENDFRAKASFELFIRSLPPERNYLLAAGLEQVLDYLETLRFQAEDIEFLRQQPVFRQVSDKFFEYLRTFRFTGEVWAIPEGTPVFHEEPLLRVTAPIIEGQIVETYLLSMITFQTMIASKAARVVRAAQGRSVIEFGTRRAHSPEAGTLGARAAYIGGCIGTSNVETGRRFGIPTFGTLAHSFVMAYDDEEEAFRRFQNIFPDHATLLVDTYDTLAAIDKIIQAELRPKAVRLDSGDVVELSRAVRQRLDEAGLTDTQIFATSDLDEFVISDLLARGAMVDAFGVGTSLAASKDAPTLGGVYKLVDVYVGERPSYRAKLSPGGKGTYPGCKQVYRLKGTDQKHVEDVVAHCSENYAEAEPLLVCVMRDGEHLAGSPRIQQVRERAQLELAKLPEECHRLDQARPYPVRFSRELQRLMEDFRSRFAQPATRRGVI